MRRHHVFIGLYAVLSVILLLFSFTQVDLSLTLSRSSFFQQFQKAFQYIGFFRRPIATIWYLGILVSYYLTYVAAIYAAKNRWLTKKNVWVIIGVVVAILLISYPAFSYDMFNYMFTAKTVMVYHKNPYMVTPLQFSGVEPWLSFMQWTHLPSAYTPLWILLTLPAYLFSFGYFLLLLWNIKIIVAASYVCAIWCISRILDRQDPSSSVVGMVVFALNPLIIIETLVSGHNDMVMMALVLAAIYVFLLRKRLLSYLLLALSVAAKLMTIFLYPVALLGWNPVLAVVAMVVGLLLVMTQREVLPWYFVWVMPFIALTPKKTYFVWIATAASLGLLLRYAPFFYLGHWNNPVPMIKVWVTSVPIIIALIFIGINEIRKRLLKPI